MKALHQEIILAEHNFAAGIEKNDLPRLVISEKFLSNRLTRDGVFTQVQNRCEEAATSLLAASTSAAMYLNRSAMTVQIDDEKSIDLGPSDDDLLSSYVKFHLEYRSQMSLCEAEIGREETRRLLPEKLARTK